MFSPMNVLATLAAGEKCTVFSQYLKNSRMDAGLRARVTPVNPQFYPYVGRTWEKEGGQQCGEQRPPPATPQMRRPSHQLDTIH